MPSPSEYIPLVNAQAQANRVSTFTPYGSTVFSPIESQGTTQGGGKASNTGSANRTRSVGALGSGLSKAVESALGNSTGGGKLSSAPAGSGITPMKSVTTFSPEVQRLFDQQIGSAGSDITSMPNLGDINQSIQPFTSQQQNISGNPFGAGAGAFNAQQFVAGNPFGQGQDAFNLQQDVSQNPFGAGSEAFNLQQGVAQDTFGGADAAFERQLNQALNPQAFNDQIQSATFDRTMNLLNPGFEQQSRRTTQMLADRGIPIGSEAYNDVISNLDRNQSQAREQAALSAVLAGNDAALRSRGQNLSELATAVNQGLSGQGQQYNQLSDIARLGLTGQGQQFGQLSDIARLGLTGQGQQFGQLGDISRLGLTGQGQQFGQLGQMVNQSLGVRGQEFGEAAQLANLDMGERSQQFNELAAILGNNQVTPTAPVDVLGPANMAMNARMAQNANQAGNKNSLVNAGAGLGAAFMLSDPSAKRDIEPIGRYEDLTLYRFKYLWSDKSEVGFMADEVEMVYPHAVKEINGIKYVNYGAVLNG